LPQNINLIKKQRCLLELILAAALVLPLAVEMILELVLNTVDGWLLLLRQPLVQIMPSAIIIFYFGRYILKGMLADIAKHRLSDKLVLGLSLVSGYLLSLYRCFVLKEAENLYFGICSLMVIFEIWGSYLSIDMDLDAFQYISMLKGYFYGFALLCFGAYCFFTHSYTHAFTAERTGEILFLLSPFTLGLLMPLTCDICGSGEAIKRKLRQNSVIVILYRMAAIFLALWGRLDLLLLLVLFVFELCSILINILFTAEKSSIA
jgi:cation transport ATPase